MIKYETLSPTELRTLRKRAGITQKVASNLCHCAIGTYKQWESGKRKMPSSSSALLTLTLFLFGRSNVEDVTQYNPKINTSILMFLREVSG